MPVRRSSSFGCGVRTETIAVRYAYLFDQPLDVLTQGIQLPLHHKNDGDQLMPSPKAGTVTPNVAGAVQEAKAGKVEYRLDKTNIIHCPIGKVSFGAEKLGENFSTLMGAILKAKPAAAKGTYIKSCVVASTMGPGIKVNAAKLG